jgi:hypothetical protein
MPLTVTVDVEDRITTYEPADNGASPLWCHGSTIVARHGDRLFVAGLETIPEEKPLNNTRWQLFGRRDGDDGWALVHRDETGRTREPSPIALSGDDLLVSANPTLTPPGQYNGPAEPTVFRFAAGDPAAAPVREMPAWSGQPRFSEHSYRTVAADSASGDVLYLQNEGYEFAHISLRRDGAWSGVERIHWPRGDEYDKPQPLRLCYPNVALRDGGAHFLGVGDIVEPVEEWREAKKQITGRDWDYVFRRIFYAATPDLATQPFGAWLELANLDQTAGATRGCDVWAAPDGRVHLLWTETSTDSRLRDRFFPDVEVRHSLQHAVVHRGRIERQRTLAAVGESDEGLQPGLARFHAVAADRVVILGQFHDRAAEAVRYRVAPLTDGDLTWTEVPFERPMGGTFLTNTFRAGSAAGPTIDLVGAVSGPGLGYARLTLA